MDEIASMAELSASTLVLTTSRELLKGVNYSKGYISISTVTFWFGGHGGPVLERSLCRVEAAWVRNHFGCCTSLGEK